ncbi:MAG: adenylosuccinate synthetase [Candidatus Altiarchaeota archaeon]|nr:adenylosuccinate synthetase [Candidatus Altiarchaeota archaeon]
MVTVVVGGHFGDEGKGKMVSYLAVRDDVDIVARAGVGPNAGHTVYHGGKEYGLRMIPCGFVNDKASLFIGAGVLVDTQRFLDEVALTGSGSRIRLDERCAIIDEKHKREDSSDKYLKNKVGTTGSGCGPANAERAHRTIKLAREIPEMEPYLADVPLELNTALDEGKRVLLEASQGFGLSLFYGTYPFVTSKDTSASMAAVDVGIGPTRVKEVIVIYKAYTTRVGEGPMYSLITEENIKDYPRWQEVLGKAEKQGMKGEDVNDTLGKYLREWGTVTQRKRRVGAFDFEMARYSSMVNGATGICITCLDKLFPECRSVTEYAGLSDRVKSYVKEIEEGVGVKAVLLSTGPELEDVVDLRKN